MRRRFSFFFVKRRVRSVEAEEGFAYHLRMRVRQFLEAGEKFHCVNIFLSG